MVMKVTKPYLILSLGAALAVLGCPAPSTPTAQVPETETVRQDETILETPAIVETEPEAPPANPLGYQVAPLTAQKKILENGSFEHWAEHQLAQWVVTPFTTPLKSTDARDGEVALELPPGLDGHYAQVQQRLPPNLICPGGMLHVSAQVKADTPNQCILKLTYERGDEETAVRAAHPGDGQWRTVAFEATVPEDAAPSTFVLQLLRRPDTDGEVVIDAVSVVSKPTPE